MAEKKSKNLPRRRPLSGTANRGCFPGWGLGEGGYRFYRAGWRAVGCGAWWTRASHSLRAWRARCPDRELGGLTAYGGTEVRAPNSEALAEDWATLKVKSMIQQVDRRHFLIFLFFKKKK